MNTVINRCRVHRGLAALPGIVAGEGRGAGPVVLVHDAALDGNPGLAEGRRLLAEETTGLREVPVHRPESLADARTLARRLAGARLVVAMGGGSLLDTTKLAMALDDPLVDRIVSARQRSGWVIGPDRPRATPLVAVPTTLGTAAEASGIVSFVHDGQKRVFTSLALQPDAALLDARCTAGLPDELLVEGCLEIILRSVGPAVGSEGPWTAADEEALRLASDVAELLHVDRSHGASARSRAALADLGVATQRAQLLRDRLPFTVKIWFLANNLSQYLRVRKMTALANLIPPYWRHLAASGPDHAERVARTWSALRAHTPTPLPADPADGFAAWLDALGVEPAPPLATDADRDEVARSCVRMWGAGLPMLAGLDAEDIRHILSGPRTTRSQTPASNAGGLMTPH